MRKRLTGTVITVILIILCAGCFYGCNDEPWFDDCRSEKPDYHYIGDGENKRQATFLLELREPTDESEKNDGDKYFHSKIDGKLIADWEVPMYGNTIYESVKKFFEYRDDNFSFRLEQRRFYMFSKCTLSDGTKYDLETVYIAVNGVYAKCANYQSILGDDGIAGTQDDVKTVVLVYRGWLY